MMAQHLEQDLIGTLDRVEKGLLAACDERGFWEGRLSSSALATATAVFALHCEGAEKHQKLIGDGLLWLSENANRDGGWGDTRQSASNISTTMLCWAAFSAAGGGNEHEELIDRTRRWLLRHAGSLRSRDLAAAVDRKYQDDKTFSVPILTMCALAGLPPGDRTGLWPHIHPLPFELALMPRPLFRWLPLSVVSYALPALISMGMVNLENRPPINPMVRFLRKGAKKRAMRVLARIQPRNGGFLEAVPLTAFVVMSLIGAGRNQSNVVRKGVEFIVRSVRNDGSWPVDTNLSTWLTSLAVRSLAPCGEAYPWPDGISPQTTLEWLLDRQYTTRHPYTDAGPGGWAWTDLPGGVPDADDTAGALIAVHLLGRDNTRDECLRAAQRGLKWLLDLQNRDGGFPTFCKGWTDMPFDRSSPDLTAHAVNALSFWSGEVGASLQKNMDRALEKALHYLRRTQRHDGSWIPLWFGNEAHPQQHNPLYGTAKVILGTCRVPGIRSPVSRAANWLLANQNDNGGWGAARGLPDSIEETALAVEALTGTLSAGWCPAPDENAIFNAARKGVQWLIRRTQQGRVVPAAPIGLYFARLWYFEELYPCIYTVSALRKFRHLSCSQRSGADPEEPDRPSGC